MSTDTTNISHLRIFIGGVFTKFEIFKQFLGLVPMQITAKGKETSKAKVQCTNIKFLNVQFFAFVSSIKYVFFKIAILKRYC